MMSQAVVVEAASMSFVGFDLLLSISVGLAALQ